MTTAWLLKLVIDDDGVAIKTGDTIDQFLNAGDPSFGFISPEILIVECKFILLWSLSISNLLFVAVLLLLLLLPPLHTYQPPTNYEPPTNPIDRSNLGLRRCQRVGLRAYCCVRLLNHRKTTNHQTTPSLQEYCYFFST